jgi:hypothetical protein
MSDTTIEDRTPETAAAPELVIPQMDIGELLDAAIHKAVSSQINAEAKKIADGVVAAMLTPEVVAGMRETAILATEQALNGAPASDEPEPESETAGPVEAAPEGEEPEQKPELRYRTLDAFVEAHMAVLYRREVTERNSGKKFRWCPRWWDHGEAVGRLEALWRAFEELRHGEGAEMAQWWVTYADPMMGELMATDGPFAYCSLAKGHTTTLAKLPTVAAPAGMFVDGHAHDDGEAAATAVVVSSLELPRPAHRARHVAMEFPG